MGPGSIVCKVHSNGLNHRNSTSGRDKNYSVHHCVQMDYDTALYPLDTRASSLGTKQLKCEANQ